MCVAEGEGRHIESKGRGVKLRPILLTAGALVVILIAPAAFVVAKLSYLAFNTYTPSRPYAVANELYSSMTAWEAYETGQVISHPYDYPYLECDDESWLLNSKGNRPKDAKGWTPNLGHEILTRSFMAHQRLIEEGAYRSLLVKDHAIPEMIVLAACIEASVLAPMCVKQVKATAWGQDKELERIISETSPYRVRAATYCRTSKAMEAK